MKVDKVGTNYTFDKPMLFRRDNIARKINEKCGGGDYGRTLDKVAMYSVSRAMIRMDGGSTYEMTQAAATTATAIACRNGERNQPRLQSIESMSEWRKETNAKTILNN